MKKFLILFATLFCTVAFAETMTINWGVDNQTYTTTTCEIGNDVLLPATPTKRGHIFKGWVAEHFDRGTWTDWASVPTNSDEYPSDTHNNKVPKENDYMIVSDASLYPVDGMTVQKYGGTGSGAYNIPIKCTIGSAETTVLFSRDSEIYICDGKIKLSCFASNYFSFYANTDMYYNGVLIHQGDLIASQHWQQGLNFTVSLSKISGTWKFVYHGIWENDGKSGWKPEQQIGE